ncbi:MAG: hypothetical protein M3O31_07190 [Acidobacteriota bacterium]|nr:hypothetical protein [Acidobacteriota bacterium]
MRDRRHFIFIPLAALLAVLPLILKGPSCGHDFEFHLHNWLEVSSQWKQGVLYPRWDFTAAWNSGEPRFVFYPPLSWTVGALLGLVIPWSAVPLAYIWLVLVACGFTMHRLACQWTSSGNALIAASFYMVHPYMLFVFYERAAYAEFLAAAWVPLLFLSILRPRLSVPGIAVPVALFWLTNAPAAVMACYSLALLAAMRIAFTYRSGHGMRPTLVEAAKITAGTLLGITLAAFYILPATFEQRWVNIDMSIRGVRYQDNFIFSHLGEPSHDAILHTASLCAVGLLVLVGIFTVVALSPRTPKQGTSPGGNRRTVLTLFFLACILGFLLSSSSASLSRHIPELSFLQFPIRWCTILGAISAALFALALSRTNQRPFAAALALIVSLGFTIGGDHFFRQPCQNDIAIPGLVAGFYNGSSYDPFDVYVPRGANATAVQHANPAFWLADSPTDAASPLVGADYSILLDHRLHFEVYAPVPRFLVLSLRDYPAWNISINGVPVTQRPHREDGLIALPVAPGISKVNLTYLRKRDETLGWILSGVSALALLFLMRRS